MLSVFFVEWAKLRNSLVSLLVLLAPLLIPVFLVLRVIDSDKPFPMMMMLTGAIGGWLMLLLPLCIIALTVLMAQMEHANSLWTHLQTLPRPRWQTFLAKALVAACLVVLMSVIVPLVSYGGLWLVGELIPAKALTGPVDWANLAAITARATGAALLMLVIQLWVALRFRNFVTPLLVGIGGVFFAVNAVSSKYGVWFPWLMTVNASLATDAKVQALALSLGLGGGLVALGVMLWDLSRRDMPA
ncbi:MAG: ABC transporter permease [Asticcacaulis sp.]